MSKYNPYVKRIPSYIRGWDLGSRQGIVQIDSRIHNVIRDQGGLTMPEVILRRAHVEYQAQGHGQTYEEIQQRGGLGLMEIITLLHDAVKRLESEHDST